MASQAEQWFKLADQDGDGAVGGAEAVRFFTRSGLPQDVLGQIWEFASGGAAKLNPMQFNTALRLVSLAQATGRLAPDQARLIAMGSGPQLPPPRLAGLTETPPTPSIPTYTPQITGLTPQVTGGVPYTAQMTGGMPYAAQVTGARPPYPGAPYMAQPTGGLPTAGPTGSGPPSGGLVPPSPVGPGAGITGGPVAAGYTGTPAAAGYTGTPAAAGSTGGLVYPPGFSPPSAADMQRYLAVFASTDADRDGVVKGSECFPVFIQSGLDKGVLKQMWDIVAGSSGHLNRDQFVRCMLLMDGLRRGLKLPAVLPPGPWPQVVPAAAGITGPQPGSAYHTGPQQQPVPANAAGGGLPPGAAPSPAGSAGGFGSRPGSMGGAMPVSPGLPGGLGAASPSLTGGLGSRGSSMGGGVVGGVTGGPLRAESWSLSSQFGHKGAVKAISEAYDQTLPKIPEPPGKVKYEGQAAPDSGPSAVPDLDVAVASMLAPADKARWEAERAEALKKEQEQRQAEAETANQKARLAVFQEALSELVMYKSKIDVAVLQAGDSAARLQSEAEDLELRYNRAQLAAQSQAEAGSKARKQLQDLLARKAEAITKLQVLQQELEMAQNLNPEELVALEREVGGLMAQSAAAEAKKATLDMQLDSGRKQKSLLSDRINELEMAAAAGEGELRRAQDELEQLQGKVLSTEASSLSPDELGHVKPLLGKAASAYRRLYSTASAAGIEVPYEANLNNVGALVWLEQLMAGTADWVDDEGALSGYSVVNALPELEGVPPALLRAAALAAAAQPPAKPHLILGAQAAAAAAAAAPAAADGEAAADGTATVEAAAAAVAAANSPAEGVSKEAQPAAAAAAEPKEAAKTDKAAAPAAAASEVKPSKAAATDGKSSATSSKAGAVAAAAAVVAGAAAVAGVSAARSGSAGEEGPAAHGDGSSSDVAAAAVPEAVTADEVDLPATVAEVGTPTAAAAAEEEKAGGFLPSKDAFGQPAASTPTAAAGGAAAAVIQDAVAPAAASSGSTETTPTAAAAGGEVEEEEEEEEEEEAVVSPPAAAPKTLLEDSDSEIGDQLHSSGAMTTPYGGLGVPAFGGLAGFDPSMYRLPDEQRTLTQQHSIDSSYAGSFTAERRRSSIEAGHTGASGLSGFEDGAPAFDSGSGAGGGAAAAGVTGSDVGASAGASAAGAAASSSGGGGAAAAGMGFEDNAF